MAVAYDNAATVLGSAVGSLTTASFTISGSDRAFVCAVTSNQTGITLSTTTCGTVSGTSAGTRAANGYWTHLHYGVAPSTGSQTAACTFSDTWGTLLRLTAATFTGVDQTTPASNYTTATGTSTGPSVTVSNTSADKMVFDGCSHGYVGTVTVGANQTAIYNVANNQWASSYQDGADGGVMSWSYAVSQAWASAALSLEPAAGGVNIEIEVPVGPVW